MAGPGGLERRCNCSGVREEFLGQRAGAGSAATLTSRWEQAGRVRTSGLGSVVPDELERYESCGGPFREEHRLAAASANAMTTIPHVQHGIQSPARTPRNASLCFEAESRVSSYK